MFAVLVTGPPGAGKTLCLMTLSDALAVDGIAHAAIDVDDVSWAFPYPDSGRRHELLAASWEAHRRDGHELLLSEMERWAVSLTELAGVHLVLDSEGIGPDELAARIRAERPDKLGG